MASISIHCPHCDGTLKLQNRSAVGKKVRCPKCQEPFVISIPDEPEDEFAVADEFDSYSQEAPQEDEDEYTPPPRSSSKKGSKKKKKSSSAQFPVMLVGGAVFLVAFLVGGGFVASSVLSSLNSSKANKLDLTYLHPDSEMFIHVRVADMLNAPLIKGSANDPVASAALAPLKQQIAMELQDMQSVTFGANAELKKSPQPNNFAMGNNLKVFESLHGIVVVRSSKPIEQEKFHLVGEAKRDQATHAGTTYFRAPHPQRPQLIMAAYFPDATTAVMGNEVDIKLAIDRGQKSERRRDMDFINPAHQFLFAMVAKNPSRLNRQASPPNPALSGSFQQLTQSMDKSTDGMAIGLTLTDGIETELLFNCTSGSGAQEIKKHLDGLVSEGRAKLAEAKQSPVALFKSIVDLGEQILNGVQTKSSGRLVTLKASVPSSAKATFEEFSKSAMGGMLMPGGGLGAPRLPQRSSSLPGAVPTAGMMPPTSTVPGAFPAGALQPGMVPPGAIPPGPAGSVSSPANNPAAAIPGAFPPGALPAGAIPTQPNGAQAGAAPAVVPVTPGGLVPPKPPQGYPKQSP